MQAERDHKRDALQQVMARHAELAAALENATDPAVLSDIFLHCGDGNNSGIRRFSQHRIEIDLLQALRTGDADTLFQLTAQIQRSYMNHFDGDEDLPVLRSETSQALAFFTIILLEEDIASDLAFFLLEFFNKQILRLESVAEILEYQRHILSIYLDQFLAEKERRYSSPVRRAMHHIRRNPRTRLTLMDIAKHCGIHPNYLSRKFSLEVGMTLSDFISAERITAIKSYLVETDMPLAEIAECFDFSSISYFSTYFRKHTNVSPSQYRKDNNRVH